MFNRCMLTHMIYELSHHAVPLPRAVIQCAVLPVFHQSHLIAETQDGRELPQEVDAVTLEAVVSIQRFVRLLEHHVRFLLPRDKRQ